MDRPRQIAESHRRFCTRSGKVPTALKGNRTCRSSARESSRDRPDSIAQRAKSFRRRRQEDRFEQIGGCRFLKNAKRASDPGKFAVPYRKKTPAESEICGEAEVGADSSRSSSTCGRGAAGSPRDGF